MRVVVWDELVGAVVIHFGGLRFWCVASLVERAVFRDLHSHGGRTSSLLAASTKTSKRGQVLAHESSSCTLKVLERRPAAELSRPFWSF